jgi:hypothetical protein
MYQCKHFKSKMPIKIKIWSFFRSPEHSLIITKELLKIELEYSSTILFCKDFSTKSNDNTIIQKDKRTL